MKLDFIENSGPNNLRDNLRAILRRGHDVSIAVAFITKSGLEGVIQPLREAAARGRVRLLTGLYQQVTQPDALDALHRLQSQTSGRLTVKLSRDPCFHRKLYVARNGRTTTTIVGSSNLTREGLRSGGELNAMIVLSADAKPIARLVQIFDDDWAHRAVVLDKTKIAKYRKARTIQPVSKSFKKGKLADILGAKPSRRTAIPEESPRRFWRDCVDGLASVRTERIISETTNWDDASYGWYSPGADHPYRIGDRLVLFDFASKRLQMVEIKDITRTPAPTPDGRHFVAYKQVGRLKRRFSKSLWKRLKLQRLRRGSARARRKLTTSQVERLIDVLRAR